MAEKASHYTEIRRNEHENLMKYEMMKSLRLLSRHKIRFESGIAPR
jgi:hypothetical protein